VFDELEEEMLGRIVEAAMGASDALAELRLGCAAFLDAAMDPAFQRIVLLDAPAVMGWRAWREADARHGLGLVTAVLTAAMDAGQIERRPVEPLGHVLLAALNEAALLVAGSDDQRAARVTVGETIDHLIAAL
jgi:hypothetical protein